MKRMMGGCQYGDTRAEQSSGKRSEGRPRGICMRMFMVMIQLV